MEIGRLVSNHDPPIYFLTLLKFLNFSEPQVVVVVFFLIYKMRIIFAYSFVVKINHILDNIGSSM